MNEENDFLSWEPIAITQLNAISERESENQQKKAKQKRMKHEGIDRERNGSKRLRKLEGTMNENTASLRAPQAVMCINIANREAFG